ncbi:ABC transporter permease [Litorilinea aerophila]|uniref:ABC transporter permease n=1 Tax=Litorilinea aerophila TaxID=1204385 RepID=A0A540VJ41_9CHLR|nr:ABC transporter permease [Litorilinea aerophila]MCC9075644.1 ABC transporter permease [Litorilinea aerophila]
MDHVSSIATPKKTGRFASLSLQEFLLRARAFIALILVVTTFSFLSPTFMTADNIIIVAKQVAINAILGIGMTFVILTGGIDLSVGSVAGLAAMIAGGLINEGLILPMFGVIVYFNVWMVILITLTVGALVGALNGLIITRFNVPPFIATLGTLYIARGLALLRSGGDTYPNLVGRPEFGNQGFPILGSGTFLPRAMVQGWIQQLSDMPNFVTTALRFLAIPYEVWIMIVFALIAAFVATKTPFGRQVYAIGGNERAAQLSGVRVKRIKVIVYMISGFCAAMVGLIIASRLVAAHPATGVFFELNAIAVVVLGGTSLMGGRGTIGGTIIGAFVIGALNAGMVMVGISSFWQQVITGSVIVLAVIIDQFQARMQERVALQKQQQLADAS